MIETEMELLDPFLGIWHETHLQQIITMILVGMTRTMPSCSNHYVRENQGMPQKWFVLWMKTMS